MSQQSESEFEISVGSQPEIQRMLLPDSTNRSLAVGLPSGTNYCFDSKWAVVQYGWQGAFLDYGPMVGYGEDRGGGIGEILGQRFSVGAVRRPLRLGDPDTVPEIEFRGYRRGSNPPELLYCVDGQRVTQIVKAVPDEPGLTYTFRFQTAPSQSIYFRTADEEIERSASTGAWDNGVLEVPAGETQFSVTIINLGEMQ